MPGSCDPAPCTQFTVQVNLVSPIVLDGLVQTAPLAVASPSPALVQPLHQVFGVTDYAGVPMSSLFVEITPPPEAAVSESIVAGLFAFGTPGCSVAGHLSNAARTGLWDGFGQCGRHGPEREVLDAYLKRAKHAGAACIKPDSTDG